VAVAFSIACPPGAVQGEGGRGRDVAALTAFRRELYRCFSKRPDALFELGDAVLCNQDRVHMLAELSLEPVFRRGHGALYDAVCNGQVQIARLRWSLAAVPLPAWADGRIRLAVDVSNWLRPTSAAAEIIRPYARISPAAQAAVAKAEAGETASALDELAELLKTAQAIGNSDLVSTCLSHIGHVQMLLGRLTDAEAALRKAIELAPEGSELRANEVTQLGDVYQSSGDNATAERLYYWVINQPEAAHTGGRISGLALANLAAIATRRGRLSEARQLYVRALTKLRSARAPELDQIAARLKEIE
jgi:tetratricopeptide (TPR) repeat protein